MIILQVSAEVPSCLEISTGLIEVLDGALERVEVIVPSCYLDVQDVGIQALYRGNQLREGGL